MELEALQQIYPEVKALGAQIVVLTPELEHYTRALHKKLNLTFDILTDLHLKTAEEFRLVFTLPDYLRELYKSFGSTLDRFHDESEYRLPIPARYVIDEEGMIRAAEVNADYTIRPEPAETLGQLRTTVQLKKGAFRMTPHREVKTFGVPWEGQYGYVQAVKVDHTIYVSGQLSHDNQGNIVGAAPLDDSGNIRDHSNMEIQMRQSYANAKKILGDFGATLENVVEEVLYVTDMEKAFAAAGPVRKEAYGTPAPQVASTLVVTPRLSFPTQLIEIKLIAKLG